MSKLGSDLDKSLDELEGTQWPAPTHDPRLVHVLFSSEKLTTPRLRTTMRGRHIGPKLAAIGLGRVNFHCEIPLVVNARSGGGSESCGRPARSSLSDVEMMWDRIRGQSFAGRFAALCSANRTERDHAKF